MSFMKTYSSIPITTKIAIGLFGGLLVGMFFPDAAKYVSPLGDLFIRLIKMIVVPLVVTTLIVGVNSVSSAGEASRIGAKTILIFMFTSLFAILLGLFATIIFQPGTLAHIDVSTIKEYSVNKTAPPFIEVVLNMIPKNPINSMAQGDMLPIIFFSIIFGMAVNILGEKSKYVLEFNRQTANIMFKVTEMVMTIVPYGVFGLIAKTVSAYGLDVFKPLLALIAVVYAGYILQILVVYTTIIKTVGKLSPKMFLKGLLEVVLVAYSTSSSTSTLPVSIRVAEKTFGIKPSVAGFVLPLGTTVNMDGTSMYICAFAIFVAQLYGIDLSFQDYILLVTSTLIASIGVAGVPSASLIMIPIVFSTVGLPVEALGVIVAVDRILDMGRTVVNVSGDLLTSCLVAKSENEMDLQLYNKATLD